MGQPAPGAPSSTPGSTKPESVDSSGPVDGYRTDGQNTATPGRGGASGLGFEASEALPRVLKMVGTVVAPTTFLTALLFYYGLLFAIGYFRYFGVNFTVLNIPTWNYLVLSAEGAVIPLVLLAGATLVFLSIYQVPLDRFPDRVRHIARWVLVPAVAGSGVTLVVLAALDAIFDGAVFPYEFPEARGLSLAGGTMLCVYAARLGRALAKRRGGPTARPMDSLRVARWAALSVLVGVGLFWAVGSYAIVVGTRNAQGLAADLACAPEVVLHTEKSLNVQVPGVVETAEGRADAAYAFRYIGLRLVPQAGDHYLFLPADWAPGKPAAILVPRGSALRMEFISAARRHGCEI
jgi:hypothetical protein